jgi:hypothetical protein
LRVDGSVGKKVPIGVSCAEGNDWSFLGPPFPDLKATFYRHGRSEGTGGGRNLGIVDKMKVPVESGLKAHASECLRDNEGDGCAPFCGVVKELHGERTDSSKGWIADDEDLPSCGWSILEEVLT